MELKKNNNHELISYMATNNDHTSILNDYCWWTN